MSENYKLLENCVKKLLNESRNFDRLDLEKFRKKASLECKCDGDIKNGLEKQIGGTTTMSRNHTSLGSKHRRTNTDSSMGRH